MVLVPTPAPVAKPPAAMVAVRRRPRRPRDRVRQVLRAAVAISPGRRELLRSDPWRSKDWPASRRSNQRRRRHRQHRRPATDPDVALMVLVPTPLPSPNRPAVMVAIPVRRRGPRHRGVRFCVLLSV